jgi:hypothetical protein
VLRHSSLKKLQLDKNKPLKIIGGEKIHNSGSERGTIP